MRGGNVRIRIVEPIANIPSASTAPPRSDGCDLGGEQHSSVAVLGGEQRSISEGLGIELKSFNRHL